ncbi:MAG: hypothetical protein V1734_05840 [Nanoarchaeota archaeon]
MRKTSLLERMIVRLTGEYTIIEEWTTELSKDKEKEYIQSVATKIEDQFPDAVILSVKKSSYVELMATAFIAFNGYVIKVAGVCPGQIKQMCMQLELNEEGKRISDLDVYYQYRKISRKNNQ